MCFRPYFLRLVLTHCKDLTNFSSVPSSLRDGIGDQINPLHAHEALASNSVRESTASARNIAHQVFLQCLSYDIFPDLGVAGQVSHAPWWDGNVFIPQAQWDNVPTSAPVGMPENISCVHFATWCRWKEKCYNVLMLIFADTCLPIPTHMP